MPSKTYNYLLERVKNNDTGLTNITLYKDKDIRYHEMEELMLYLKDNHILKELTISKCGFYDTHAKSLAAALRNNHTLTRLCLQHNSIGGEGARSLILALKNKYTLNTTCVS